MTEATVDETEIECVESVFALIFAVRTSVEPDEAEAKAPVEQVI